VGLIVTWAAALPALGTVVFICFLEEHPRVLPVVAPVFSAVASASPERSVQRLPHQ
jgi:hypothetical protein